MKLTLLEEKQIVGKNRLKIFDEIGIRAAITDYAIALGGYVANNHFIKNGNNELKDRAGYYWTKTPDYLGPIVTFSVYSDRSDARVILCEDMIHVDYEPVYLQNIGIRPALRYSEISFFAKNIERGSNGVITLECGSLPKYIVPDIFGKQLEDAYFGKSSQNLEFQRIDTGYTGDARSNYERDKPFLKEEYPSILVNNDIYTRVPIKPRFNSEVKLSNGEIYQVGDFVWMKKAPVIWYYDEESGIVFTKDLISAGVQFNHERNYKGDFSKTDMYQFLNTYLMKDMGLTSTDTLGTKNREKVKSIGKR